MIVDRRLCTLLRRVPFVAALISAEPITPPLVWSSRNRHRVPNRLEMMRASLLASALTALL
jgi:hypothetical protein